MSFGGQSTTTCKPEEFRYSASSSADIAISPAPVKEDIHNSALKGKAASIQRIANSGHLVPLVQPDSVADAILKALGSLSTAKSRL